MPLLSEDTLKEIATGLSATDAAALRTKAAAGKESAGNAETGRQNEITALTEKHGRIHQQRARRSSDGREEMAAHATAFYKSSSKSSIEAASATLVRHDGEARFLAQVLVISQAEIEKGRQRLQLAELEVLKANLLFLEADVVCMAVDHLLTVAELKKQDPDIEVEFGPAITAGLDLVANLHIHIERKKRELLNG